ncbi:MAG TPA: hypothetical protein VGA08_03855 [Candidatus Saccharimonadales bacterium]
MDTEDSEFGVGDSPPLPEGFPHSPGPERLGAVVFDLAELAIGVADEVDNQSSYLLAG